MLAANLCASKSGPHQTVERDNQQPSDMCTQPSHKLLHKVFSLLWEQPCVSTACSARLKPCKVSALSHSPELEAWWGTARKRISVSLLICQPLNSVNAYGCHAEQEKSLFHSGPLFHTFEPLSAITSFPSQVPRIPITSEWNLPTSHLFCTKLSWTFPYSPFCLSIQHFFSSIFFYVWLYARLFLHQFEVFCELQMQMQGLEVG